jgi:hypothetical protein
MTQPHELTLDEMRAEFLRHCWTLIDSPNNICNN